MLKAPNLQCLHIIADRLSSYVLEEMHCLHEAVMHISYAEWSQVAPYRAVELLMGLSKTKFLSVNCGIMSVSPISYSHGAFCYVRLLKGYFMETSDDKLFKHIMIYCALD